MAKIQTMDEMAKELAENALDNFLYDGKSLREWMKIIASEDAISRQAVLNLTKELRFNSVKGMEDYCYRCIDTDDVEELPPIQPRITQMVDKSNFDNIQYKADLDTAYECGKASVQPKTDTLDKIRAEIIDKYMTATGEVNTVAKGCLQIIDKYKAESEDEE